MTQSSPTLPSSRKRVGIMGLGYTGLPMAIGFAEAGHPVTGYDIDGDKLAVLRAGKSYLTDILDESVAATSGALTATGSSADLAETDAIVVCVPTPVAPEGEPDLSILQGALDTLAGLLRPGMLVILQSTVPPGTTASAAEFLAEKSGLTAGTDFFVANAPERINPANRDGWTLANTPKLVGGLNEESTRQARQLLESVCQTVVPVRTLEIAETAKVFENTFRLVNIALTYDLADLCKSLGIPVREVIDAAATKPYGFLAHHPGPGIGGECIAVDPLFLKSVAAKHGREVPLIDAAHRRMLHRPQQVVDRTEQLLNDADKKLYGSKVLIVGVAYKPEVSDTRNSPARDIAKELRRQGAEVSYVDPYVAEFTADGESVPRVAWERSVVLEHDCLVLTTLHDEFTQRPLWYAAPLVLDAWNRAVVGDGVFHL
ncbi:nucleotide sugar dehydrogenase [Streptomyces sp. NPDC059697]|uniref:nucleotide sugar dehydrogenase n=1 Tax=Streptomyces sp. NPDC059697 TaxID=3346912 RepID=UPI0036AF197C